MRQAFREVEHTADRAFTVRGRELRDLFMHAAQAVLGLRSRTAQTLQPVKREVEVTGTDRETLLVNWLNELLFLSERFQERYERFEILDLTDEHVRARLGGTLAPTVLSVKAVTFHNLAIRREGAEWVATVVVDV